MTSIVLELQSDALNPQFPLTDLLRKAYLIASKLHTHEFKKWIENELNGYDNEQSLPKYREAPCEIKAWNPYYNSWIPVIIRNLEFEKKVKITPLPQPISELEKLKPADAFKGQITCPLSGTQISILQQATHCDMFMTSFLPNTIIDKICETVRTLILDWAIKLEEQGILGEGLIFKPEEQTKANLNSTINFIGNVFGNTFDNSITQSFNITVNKGSLTDLASFLRSNQIEESDINEIIDAVQTDPQPTTKKFGQQVNNWLGKMISKTVNGAWNITTNVATGILIRAISQYYGLD